MKTRGGLLVTSAERRVLASALEYAEHVSRLGADRAIVGRALSKLTDASTAYYSELRAAKKRGQRK